MEDNEEPKVLPVETYPTCYFCGFNSCLCDMDNYPIGQHKIITMAINTSNINKIEFDKHMQFTVIGLLGPAGSGKDLVADWFCDRKNFVKVAFADPMKRFTARCFGIDHDVLWGPSEKRDLVFSVSEDWWFNAVSNFGTASEEILNKVLDDGDRVSGYLKLHSWFTDLRKTFSRAISPRVILQTLGTEWGRSVNDLIWVNYAYKIIEELKADPDKTYGQSYGLGRAYGTRYKGVIIPDHRFKNEVIDTQNKGGYVLRLRRLALEGKPTVGITDHKSEKYTINLPDELFNLVLNLPEGIDKVHEILSIADNEKKIWMIPQASGITIDLS